MSPKSEPDVEEPAPTLDERSVQTLSTLAVGRDARVVAIAPRDPTRRLRLAHFGLVAGATIHLQQRTPATVLRVGETTLAVEPDVAAEIYVRRLPGARD